jgi:hypothetical protein
MKDFAPYPERRECVPFDRCEVCHTILIDDDGCSWPYCPQGPHGDPAMVQLEEFVRELAEDWPVTYEARKRADGHL